MLNNVKTLPGLLTSRSRFEESASKAAAWHINVKAAYLGKYLFPDPLQFILHGYSLMSGD
jgi:hypothetical protein